MTNRSVARRGDTMKPTVAEMGELGGRCSGREAKLAYARGSEPLVIDGG